MYATGNPKTKKVLRERVAAYLAEPDKGRAVTAFSPGPFPCPKNGWIDLEGPHYPEPHRWYAEAWLEEGVITKVK